jgi:hypothetical protein
MTMPMPTTRPASDARFRTLVHRAVQSTGWTIASPEGAALLEAVLRADYPSATVVVQAQTELDALHELDPIVVAYRDGFARDAELDGATGRERQRPMPETRGAQLPPNAPLVPKGISPVPGALAAWRAAERSLAALSPDDSRSADAVVEIDRLRAVFHAAVARIAGNPRVGGRAPRDTESEVGADEASPGDEAGYRAAAVRIVRRITRAERGQRTGTRSS